MSWMQVSNQRSQNLSDIHLPTTAVSTFQNPIGFEQYRKIANIRRTESQNLTVSRLVLQLYLPNPMKPGVKSRMKMYLEQRRQAMLQLHLSDWQFYCLLRCVLN